MGRDVESIEAFLDEHESSLLAYAHTITGGDLPLARRLLEHALIAVYSRRRKHLTIDSPETQIRRIIATTYLSRDRIRRRRLAVRQLFRPHEWAPPVGLADEPDALFQTLRDLGPRERVCLIRYVLDSRTIEEISREVTLPVERVRACLQDSLSLIEGKLGPMGEIDLDTIPVLGRGAG